VSEHAPILYPSMRYRDAAAAIEFLKRAFGFQEEGNLWSFRTYRPAVDRA
jgi:uncharacterized glyoxalase superfamily protein PhnB